MNTCTGDRGHYDEQEAGRTIQSLLKKYWERAEELEEYSLFKLNLTHNYSKGSWKRNNKENIVRIRPRPSGLRNGEQWEEFCRIKVILHVPHRSIEQLRENSDTWSTIYNQHIDIINAGKDIIGPAFDEEQT